MKALNVTSDFSKQDFHIGIDVHLKQWHVTIRGVGMELKTFSMNPSPKALGEYMKNHYPLGRYHSTYEAGFSGFGAHEALTSLGFNNIVVHPADIPSMNKERHNKRDAIDSRKLARELAHGSLTGIYTPDRYHQELRSLCRLRERSTRHQTRLKCRIKSYLAFYSISIPEHHELCHWSGRFIEWLKAQRLKYDPGNTGLALSLKALEFERAQLVIILRSLREEVSKNPELTQTIGFLQSVPGIGFTTAITLYSEIMDIQRFKRLDELASFAGLAPAVYASGDHQVTLGLTTRHNAYLRYMLIEAAWVAVRLDPALTEAFAQLTERMTKQNAIVRIAKKLLSRIRYVWLNQTPYQKGIIQ